MPGYARPNRAIYMRVWCQRLAFLPSKQMGSVRIRLPAPEVDTPSEKNSIVFIHVMVLLLCPLKSSFSISLNAGLPIKWMVRFKSLERALNKKYFIASQVWAQCRLKTRAWYYYDFNKDKINETIGLSHLMSGGWETFEASVHFIHQPRPMVRTLVSKTRYLCSSRRAGANRKPQVMAVASRLWVYINLQKQFSSKWWEE